MDSLIRIANITTALRGTPHQAEAEHLFRVARRRAHSHPRGKLDNLGRRLRRLAKNAGVWRPGLGLE
jgi:hypothetical protein